MSRKNICIKDDYTVILQSLDDAVALSYVSDSKSFSKINMHGLLILAKDILIDMHGLLILAKDILIDMHGLLILAKDITFSFPSFHSLSQSCK